MDCVEIYQWVLCVFLLIVGLGQASSRPTGPRLISTQQTNQTLWNRSVCVGRQRMPSSRLMCCGGHLFPKRHFRYKCLGSKPFKRTRTKLSCDNQLYTKRQREKYGCCGNRRYRRLHLICYKDHTYKQLTKVPCPPGLEYKYTVRDRTGRRNLTVCTPCGAGLYSGSFGFSPCKRCSRCESYEWKCSPTHDSSCRRGQHVKPEENKTVRTTRGIWKFKSAGTQKRTEDDLPPTPAAEDIFQALLFSKRSSHGGYTSTQMTGVSTDASEGLELDEKEIPPAANSSKAIRSAVFGGIAASVLVSLLLTLCGYFITKKKTYRFCFNERLPSLEIQDLHSTCALPERPDPMIFRNSHRRSSSDPGHVITSSVCNRLRRQKFHSSDAEWSNITGEPPRPSEPLLFDSKLTPGINGNRRKDLILTRVNMIKQTGSWPRTQRARTEDCEGICYWEDDLFICGSPSTTSLLGTHQVQVSTSDLQNYPLHKDAVYQIHRSKTEIIALPKIPPGSNMRFQKGHKRSASDPVEITMSCVYNRLRTNTLHSSMYGAEWKKTVTEHSKPAEPLFLNNMLSPGAKRKNEKQDITLTQNNIFIDEGVEKIRAESLSLSSECVDSNTNRLNRNNYTQTSSLSIAQWNILGVEWDRFGKFDHRGGVLKKSGSDVVLTVPKNAITGGNVSSILGKIYTSLPQFVPIFNLKEGDRFVAPVVEFSDYPPTRFERHLQLKIPIVSSCESCSSFRVLSIPGNGDMTVEQVPFLDSVSSNPPDMYYQLKGDGFAHVYTKHFTAFTCVCCDRNHLHLDGVVFGQCKRIQNKFEAGIRLYICDRLYLIQDFRKILDESEAEAGRKRMDEKVIRLRNPDLQDEISMQVELTSDAWTPKLRRNGNPVFEPPKAVIEDLTLCPQQTEMPTVAGEWKFISADESIPFGCILDVVHLTRESPSPCTTFDLQLKTFTMQFEQENKQKVTENLASELTLNEALRLARKLNVSETTLECIKTNNNNDCRETILQTMLHCQRRHGEESFKEKLPSVLRSIDRVDLAEKLEKNQNVPKTETSPSVI